MTYRKKLIEVALPLKAINEASAREKSIRHGHPSTLHLWWARRPLAACRAVLFASFVDDPDSDPMYAGAGEEIAGRKPAELFNLIETRHVEAELVSLCWQIAEYISRKLEATAVSAFKDAHPIELLVPQRIRLFPRRPLCYGEPQHRVRRRFRPCDARSVDRGLQSWGLANFGGRP